jgi:predicted nuclease with TOPRIM domain
MHEKEKEARGSYVHRVREETHRFANDLMAENEKLRARLAASDNDKTRAQEQLVALQEEIERDRREHVQLQQRLVEIEGENQSFSQRFLEVEQNNSNLANLYVVSYRLHGTLDRSEVLSVIEEIIINLIGSEELAIFEVDQAGSSLDLVASFGMNPKIPPHPLLDPG